MDFYKERLNLNENFEFSAKIRIVKEEVNYVHEGSHYMVYSAELVDLDDFVVLIQY